MSSTIKRALVSVTDKTGVVDFCRSLVEDFSVEIVSTGGTAAVLQDAGIAVTSIEAVTGFPEMMDGRVKTLHPKVHGGLLAKRDNAAHMDAAKQHDITAIDLVVVNLYAFEAAVAKEGASEEEVIENIDIGGPSMLRSAAKNFASVTVVTNPADYPAILEEMQQQGGTTTLETRKKLAMEVFDLTARYDGAITAYLSNNDKLHIAFEKVQDLRYGENPHQAASYYRYPGDVTNTLAAAKQLQGKELSYNNILDTDAAWGAVREFTEPACVIVKHTNPCGAAVATSSDTDIVSVYQRAWEGDPISAFGGIIALNRSLTAAVVEAIFANKQFVEVIVAPRFEPAALELLATKPNMRLLETGGVNSPIDAENFGSTAAVTAAGEKLSLRSVEGGVLAQAEDAATEDPATFMVVSKAQPTQQQMDDLVFAWKVCKSVKSNAITIAKDSMMLGMGAGQPNRVNSARVAINQAEIVTDAGAKGGVAASDAFIPFPDTVQVLADAGISAIIHPGGSIRDEEVIAAADAAGVVLVATKRRHFRH